MIAVNARQISAARKAAESFGIDLPSEVAEAIFTAMAANAWRPMSEIDQVKDDGRRVLVTKPSLRTGTRSLGDVRFCRWRETDPSMRGNDGHWIGDVAGHYWGDYAIFGWMDPPEPLKELLP